MSKVKKKTDITFSKEQLIKSSKYKHSIDLVSVLLEDGKRYSLEEVNKMIDKYMKGSVK